VSAPTKARASTSGVSVGAGILGDLAGAPASEQQELLVDHVLDVVTVILRLPDSARPAANAGLFDLGLDSLMALDFRRQLQTSLELEEELPATLIFDCPNADAIAQFLANERLDIDGSDAAPTSPMSESNDASVSDDDIAEMSDEDIEALLLQRLDADKG
ncbi:MAG: acyl carrier protein, partial [Pseudomonadota bacterium]